MNWRNYIHSDNDVLLGKPVIKGTRLSVVFILELLAARWSVEKILENYSLLKPEHIQAVFHYASDCLKDDQYLTEALMVKES